MLLDFSSAMDLHFKFSVMFRIIQVFKMTALAEVQSALSEFYAQTSSPERLAQLQQSLINFEQQPSSWVAAIQFLSLSSDQYVCMFSLGIVESTVKQRWSHLSGSEKLEIFQFLEKYAFSTNNHTTSSSCLAILNCKAVKIWTSICKADFTHFHTLFFSRIIGLLTSIPVSVTTEVELRAHSLSFSLFKAACEELLRQDPEISQSKASENAFLFGQSAPQLFTALFEVIERLLLVEINNPVKTMLSTHQRSISETQFFTALRAIVYFDANILFSISNTGTEEMGKLTNLLLKNLTSFLECLAVLLAVSPITDIDQCRLYSLLYTFIVMGSPRTLSTLIDASRSRNLSPNVQVDSLAEIGMHSLNCLTEVVERKDVSRDVMLQHLSYIYRVLYWDMLMQDTQFPLSDLAMSVINSMADSGITLSTSNSIDNLSGLASITQSLESLSEDFYQKLADILRPIITVYLLFYKSSNSEEEDENGEGSSLYAFSPAKFLQRMHFFTFTVSRPMISVYLSTLDLWNSYLDFVKSLYYSETSNSNKQVQLPAHIQQIISSLCSSLLKTLYFSDSASYLEVLEIEYPSGNSEETELSTGSYLAFFEDIMQQADSADLMADADSEYAVFMKNSMTLLSMIAFFNPTAVLNSVAAKFQDGLNVFTQLCNTTEGTRLEEHVTRKLHYALRDLATCLNCLAYLLENLCSMEDSSMLRWLVEALVYNLSAGVNFCDRLKSLRVETLQQDIIQVIVENINLLRCLLASGFLIVSEGETLTAPRSYVVLSIDDKNALATALLQNIHHLLLSSSIASLRIQAALLFQTLIVASTPPGFLPPSSLLSEGAFMADLITCCCEPNRLKVFSIPVQRLLMRTITAYLLIDESSSNLAKFDPKRANQMEALATQKTAILLNRLMPVFSQALRRETLTTDRDAYFAGLCWLNEALVALVPLGGRSRRVMYETMTSCGLLTSIWQCLETASLSSEAHHVFLAHLSFFVQFTDIYGNLRTTAATIPRLVSTVMQLLQVLEQNTVTARLVSPVISHLLRLIDRLVQNRTVFPPLAPEVLRFISNCLVVNIAGCTSNLMDLPNTVAAASKNDPDLCLKVFATLFNAVSYAYNQLCTTSEEHLATFLRPVLAVYGGQVFDPRLLITCAESLLDLNTRHRFFALPAFVMQWRNELAKRLLALLIAVRVDGKDGVAAVQRGSDAEGALIRALYALYSSGRGFAINEFCETAAEAIITEAEAAEGNLAGGGAKAEITRLTTTAFSQAAEIAVEESSIAAEKFGALLDAFLIEARQWIRAVGQTGKFNGKTG